MGDMELVERIVQLEQELKALRPDLHFPSTATLEQRLRWLEIVMEEMRAKDNHGVYAETPSEEKLQQILAHTVYIKPDRITLHSLTADPASCVGGDMWFRSDLKKGKLAEDAVVASAKLFPTEAGGWALLFGDGSDGNVTISATTTLSRDMYYNNLTVNAGVTLNTNGYRIFVKGTLTNNGTIQNNGTNAVAGVGGGAGVSPGGSLGGGGSGGSLNPYDGDGTLYYESGGGGGGGVILIVAKSLVNNGTIQANGGNGADGSQHLCMGIGPAGGSVNPGLGGPGGGGGTYSSYTGGAGGSVTALGAARGGLRAIPFCVLLKDGTTAFGGGGGGGSGGNYDGYGGSGGGGGGGGAVVIVYGSATWGTEQANGGGYGVGWNGGSSGAAGSAGTVIKIQAG